MINKLPIIILAISLPNCGKTKKAQKTEPQQEVNAKSAENENAVITSIQLPNNADFNLAISNPVSNFNKTITEALDAKITMTGECTKLRSEAPTGKFALDFRVFSPPEYFTSTTTPLIHINSVLKAKLSFEIPSNCEIATMKIKGLDAKIRYQIGGEIGYINATQQKSLLYFGASNVFIPTGQGVSVSMKSFSDCANSCTIYTDQPTNQPQTQKLADFNASITSGNPGLNVNFTDQSNFTATSWAWDFNNDGTIDATTKNPSFTYQNVGTFSVKLTAKDANGEATKLKENLITITNTTTTTCNTEKIDNFDSFDTNYWYRADGYKNGLPFLVGWKEDRAKFVDGKMELHLDNTGCPSGCVNENYAAATYQTKGERILYGRFEARFKASNVPGTISSLFTYTGPSDNQPWDEIDIEILGKDPTKMQVNYWTAGVEHPVDINLGFDASQDFHVYAFEWRQNSIRWFVDGVKVHEETGTKGALPSHNMKVFMNYWAAQGWDKAGTFTYNGPSKAVYDYYKYTPISCLAP